MRQIASLIVCGLTFWLAWGCKKFEPNEYGPYLVKGNDSLRVKAYIYDSTYSFDPFDSYSYSPYYTSIIGKLANANIRVLQKPKIGKLASAVFDNDYGSGQRLVYTTKEPLPILGPGQGTFAPYDSFGIRFVREVSVSERDSIYVYFILHRQKP